MSQGPGKTDGFTTHRAKSPLVAKHHFLKHAHFFLLGRLTLWGGGGGGRGDKEKVKQLVYAIEALGEKVSSLSNV